MSKIINLPSLVDIKSMVTVPLRYVATDLEYVRDSYNRKFCVSEICFWDIESNKKIFKTLIRPDENFTLSKRLKDRGITYDHLLSAPSMAELDQHLKFLLPSCILVFWNEDYDLKQYPALKHYSYATRCCMKRFSERHGSYNYSFGDHSYMKLKDACLQAGFSLESHESFHEAQTDARATSFLWNQLNQESLPEPINMDLILRSDVDHLLEKKDLEDEDSLDGNEVLAPF